MAATSLVFYSLLSLLASRGHCWSSFLPSGGRLSTDERLVYRHYHLIMQGDCNLVLYREGHGAIWHTNTAYNGKDCYLTVDSNGELILRGDRFRWFPGVIWRSKVTSEEGSYALVVKHDGTLHVYGPSIWSTTNTNTLSTGKSSGGAVVDSTLWSGDIAPIGVTIAYGDYKLELPTSCNLTLSNTKTGGILWYANIKDDTGIQDCYVNLGGNGELMIKYLGGAPLWSNGKAGATNGDYVLALLADGKMVVYGPPIWSSAAGTEEGKKIAMVTEE